MTQIDRKNAMKTAFLFFLPLFILCSGCTTNHFLAKSVAPRDACSNEDEDPRLKNDPVFQDYKQNIRRIAGEFLYDYARISENGGVRLAFRLAPSGKVIKAMYLPWETEASPEMTKQALVSIRKIKSFPAVPEHVMDMYEKGINFCVEVEYECK